MAMKNSTEYLSGLAEMANARVTGDLDGWNHAYITPGGTYIIASQGKWNDSGKPRDLVAVLPGRLEGSRVIPLSITVSSELIDTLRAALD